MDILKLHRSARAVASAAPIKVRSYGVTDYNRYWLQRKRNRHVESIPRHFLTVEQIRQRVAMGKRVLDLGVGPGNNYRLLMSAYETWGCEISSEIIASYDFDRSRIVNCDLNRGLPDFERPFDAAVASMIFHHMDRPQTLAESIAAVLSPGAVLVAVIPNITYWKNRLKMLRGHFPRLTHSHRNFQTWREFAKMMAASRFRLESVVAGSPVGFPARWFPRLLAKQLILVFRRT